MKSRLVTLASTTIGAAMALGLAVLPAGSARAADPSFSLKVDVPPAKAGEKATVKLHVKPGSGYHMNKEFPTALTLTPPAGLTLEKTKLLGKDARLEEGGADFDVVLTATEKGSKVVTGDLKFAVCSATSCDPKREKVSFTVDVK